MIDGVEVLTSEMVRTSPEFDELIGIVILCAIVVVTMLYLGRQSLTVDCFLLAAIALIVAGIFGFLGYKSVQRIFTPTYEERYMVQLKKEVPLDFIKNYEILEDKGNDIYIVREKGNE